MARPTSRLDIYLVPDTLDASAVDLARARLATAKDVLGVQAKHLRVDDPRTPVLYANQVGGFRPTCVHCSSPVAAGLQPLGLTPCGGCGRELPFTEVACHPPAAVGRAALVLCDVNRAVWEDPEGWRVVLRRC